MYKECIQKTLDLIESDLKNDIDAESLAKSAGYSLYHFYRIFQDTTGFPVMQYILRRRAREAKRVMWHVTTVSIHIRGFTDLLFVRPAIHRQGTFVSSRLKSLIRSISYRRNTL